MNFLLGWPIFRGKLAVSFREGTNRLQLKSGKSSEPNLHDFGFKMTPEIPYMSPQKSSGWKMKCPFGMVPFSGDIRSFSGDFFFQDAPAFGWDPSLSTVCDNGSKIGILPKMKSVHTTLHETSIFAPENGWLESYFPFGMAYFQGRAVSFREGKYDHRGTQKRNV